MTAKNKPSLFEYDNYRTYLSDMYAYYKSTTKSFSYRYFSIKAGLKSPNFLKLVINGQRNLSSDSIEKCSHVFKHNAAETKFFRNLVSHNQAISIEEKTYFTEQIIKSTGYKKVNPLSEKQYAYYSNWHSVPLREMIASEYFQEDPKWIARQFNPHISPSEAQAAIDTLLDLKLIRRNERGRLEQTDTLVASGDDVKNSFITQWHRQMIQKGSEALDRFKSDQREISALTLGLSRQSAAKAKKMIRQFKQQLMDLAAQEKNVEGVYQLNFQLFALTNDLSEE